MGLPRTKKQPPTTGTTPLNGRGLFLPPLKVLAVVLLAPS